MFKYWLLVHRLPDRARLNAIGFKVLPDAPRRLWMKLEIKGCHRQPRIGISPLGVLLDTDSFDAIESLRVPTSDFSSVSNYGI
jgi:hypothetical protein